jgi:hypothetical protein
MHRVAIYHLSIKLARHIMNSFVFESVHWRGRCHSHVNSGPYTEIVNFWDHEISIIVTSIHTVLTVFRRKLDLSSLLIMEIVTIHSWKSQYISVWFSVMIYCVIC